MGIFGRKRQARQLSRREILAQRRAGEQQTASTSSAGVGAYRRSSTLTGRKTVDLESSERQTGWDLRKRRRKLLYWLAAAGGVALLTLFLLSQLVATVVVRTPDPSQASDHQKYRTIVDEYFSVRPLERLRFVTNQAAMEQYLIDHASEVRSAEVVGGSVIGEGALQLSFRQPTLRWSSGDMNYFVDDLGVTFEKNYFDDPAISVEDKSGVPAELGQEVVNRRFLSFLGQAVALFRQNDVEVTGVVLPESTVRQVEFAIGGKSYGVKMTVDRAVEDQVSEALHAIEFLDQRSRRPEYVDVRVDQRVFYK